MDNIKYYFVCIIAYLSFLTPVKAQCISGDCDKGIGTYVFKSGSKYEGAFKNGKKNGKGKFTFSSGDIYEGDYLNDEETGNGKYTAVDGTTEIGKFLNGKLNGYATITFKAGGKYTGNFVNDKMNGSGIYYFANGDRFEGAFKDDKRNGNGVLYYVKGGKKIGIWKDDEYMSGSNQTSNSKEDTSVIQLIKNEGGVYETPVLINGVLKFNMIFDSGASEVYFTPDVVLTLFRTKTVTNADILEGGSYSDANGNVNKSLRFRIRELKIGNAVITDIAAGVSSSIDGSNLLGLSALEKLGKLEIDFVKLTVVTVK